MKLENWRSGGIKNLERVEQETWRSHGIKNPERVEHDTCGDGIRNLKIVELGT